MEYKLLSSVFYKGQEEYQKLYDMRIGGESTYLFNFNVKNNQAFSVINHDMLDRIDKILDLNCKLSSLVQSLPSEASEQYAKRCLLDEVYLTNTIEGVYSTRSEINEILETKIAPKKYKRLYALVKKYETLIGGENISLSCSADIRNLYDEFMLKDVIKEDPKNMPDGRLFRKDSVYISGKHGDIVHTGIKPEEDIILSMQESLDMVNCDDYNFLVRVAVFHYMFGYIHPFYDGNGRMSRFISSYLLSKKLHYLVACRLSCSVKNKLSSYYKGFNVCNDEKNKGDLTYFILNFFDIIIDAEEELYEALIERRDKYYFYLQKIDQCFEDAKVIKVSKVLIQNTLFGNIGLSVDKICDSSGLGQTNVRNSLKKLEDMNLLRKDKISRIHVYDLNLDSLVVM